MPLVPFSTTEARYWRTHHGLWLREKKLNLMRNIHSEFKDLAQI